MPTFTPPVEDGFPWSDADPRRLTDRDRLFAYYGAIPTGVTVWRDQEGVWHQSQYPWQGGADYRTFFDGQLISETHGIGIADAQVVYIGGHVYNITNQEAQDLEDAGFGDFITYDDFMLLAAPSDKADSIFSTTSTTPVDIPGWDSITVTVPTGTWYVEARGHMITTVGGNGALSIFMDDTDLLHDADGFRTALIGVMVAPKMRFPNPIHAPIPGTQVTFRPRLWTTTGDNVQLICGNFLGSFVTASMEVYSVAGP